MAKWFAIMLFIACSWYASANVKSSPNIIFILADDLGYGELGCYGQQVIQTPRIDRMALEGLRFTHFYAGATVCAPSRSVLMTGQHHGRTRVRGNARAKNPGAQALLDGEKTIAQMLKQQGYKTALVGKWGLGDKGAAVSGLPRRQGFDYFFGYLNQCHAHNHFPDFMWRNEKQVRLPNIIVPKGPDGAGYAMEAKVFADALFTEEALAFVRDNRATPFFLFWSMVIPHANNERAIALGDGAEVPDYGLYADKPWPMPDKGHAAMITLMDSYVGRMLDELRVLGIAENTLVIFTSDNGPHNESYHDLTRFTPSGPFSGIKRSLTDGGIRVPCIVWWPGRVGGDGVSGHVAYFGDWMATFAELVGTVMPEGRDSLSLASTLTGNGIQARHEFLYWEFHEGGFRQAALYDGRWKGIQDGAPNASIRLYDQQQDVAETNDVAALYPDVAAKISDYLNSARTESAEWLPNWRVLKAEANHAQASGLLR